MNRRTFMRASAFGLAAAAGGAALAVSAEPKPRKTIFSSGGNHWTENRPSFHQYFQMTVDEDVADRLLALKVTI